MVRSNLRSVSSRNEQPPGTSSLPLEDRKPDRESRLSKAPKLWVDYKPGKRGSSNPADAWESLVLSKEGEAEIKDIRIGPLVWTARESRPIELHSVISTALTAHRMQI